MDHDVYDVYNGMAAAELSGWPGRRAGTAIRRGRAWSSRAARGDVAVRNSRFPDGPALVYTCGDRGDALGVKDGEFDHLIA